MRRSVLPLTLWILLFILLALAAAAYAFAWPYFWRAVSITSEPGFDLVQTVAYADTGQELWRAKQQSLNGTLEQSNTSLYAYALFRAKRPGKHRFILECDDNGAFFIDRRQMIGLHGVNARAIGEAALELEQGPHLIQVTLNNIESKGWFRLLVQAPGEAAPVLVEGDLLAPLGSEPVHKLLAIVRTAERISGLIMLACFAGFFLLLVMRLDNSAVFKPTSKAAWRALFFALLVLGVSLVCGWYTVNHHQDWLNRNTGENYLAVSQLDRHNDTLDTPSEHRDHRYYRLFPVYLLEGFFSLAEGRVSEYPPEQAFFWFRFAIDALTFLLAALFYRRLGLNRAAAILGMGALFWCLLHTHYNSDLNFSTHLDAVFYLTAGLLVLDKRWTAFVIVSMLAVLNKETALLIPFMPLALAVRFKPLFKLPRKELLISAGTFALCVGLFFAIRYAYGWTGMEKSHDRPGLHFLWYNLNSENGLRQLFYFLGPLPIAAVMGLKRAPLALARWFWLIVPVWFAVHTLVAWWEEPRVFVVVMGLLLIPLALFAAQGFMPSREKAVKKASGPATIGLSN